MHLLNATFTELTGDLMIEVPAGPGEYSIGKEDSGASPPSPCFTVEGNPTKITEKQMNQLIKFITKEKPDPLLMDISTLLQGFYFIRLYMDDENVVHKVIVQ